MNVKEPENPDKPIVKNVPDKPRVYVYCGPTVKGVAHRGTVYQGDMPEALKRFINQHPIAAGLVADLERFADVRQRIETEGTAENLIYARIKSEL